MKRIKAPKLEREDIRLWLDELHGVVDEMQGDMAGMTDEFNMDEWSAIMGLVNFIEDVQMDFFNAKSELQ